MRPAHTIRLLAFGLVLLSCGSAAAQGFTYTRRPVRGAVTGLEMTIEGPASARRGERLRWLLTLYEIVGQRELRPAPNATIRVAASFRRDEHVATAETDEFGRAEVALDIPEDLDRTITIVMEAVSTSRIRREFRFGLSLHGANSLELFVDRDRATPGETISLWGRVTAAATGRPVAGEEVALTLTAGNRTLQPARSFVSGPLGAFATSFVLPDVDSECLLTARLPGENFSVRHSLDVDRPRAPELVVRAVPSAAVVRPGEEISVDIMVRRPDGRPVAGAVIEEIEPREPRAAGEQAPQVRTDSTGRARVQWRARSLPRRHGVAVVNPEVVAVRPGIGRGRTHFRVRQAFDNHDVAVAAEGGALVPGVPGRLFVRVVQPDGSAAPAGTPVELRSARLGTATGRVGADGVALLDVEPRATGSAEDSERCGGASAAGATLTIAGGGAAGTERTTCVPLDPDATLVVRAAPLAAVAGDEITVTLHRAARVRNAPVVVTLLDRGAENELVPLHHEVLAAGTNEVTLTIPAVARREVIVRARPLIGSSRQEVRGGSALVWVTHDGPLTTAVDTSAPGELAVSTAGGAEQTRRRGLVMLVPDHRAAPAIARLRTLTGDVSRRLPRRWRESETLLAATLASRTPVDVMAPAVLRGTTPVDMPALADPVAGGVLRDPWRARARFVTGRLALILRALEQEVSTALLERRDDVAVQSGGRWSFNRQVLDAMVNSARLGADGARGLGGAPLTMDQIEALDPAITYDNMARRITRERLLRLLLALRDFVRSRNLDMTWAVRGDRATWLPQVAQQHTNGGAVGEAGLRDGWGRPFALRRATGGRPRFDQLVPVAGYELVSAGPDGRFGNADDMYDPYARVLPSGSPYAEAVGEDELLARLRGVELGRAALQAYARHLGGVSDRSPQPRPGGRRFSSWTAVVGPVAPVPQLDDLQRTWNVPDRRPGPLSAFELPREARRPLPPVTDDEQRRFQALALVWSASGTLVWDAQPLSRGVPMLLETDLPARLRVQEPLVVPIRITRLAGGPAAVTLQVNTTGGVVVSHEAPGANEGDTTALELPLELDDHATLRLRLTLSSADPGELRLRLRGRDGSTLRSLDHPISLHDGALRRTLTAAGGLADEPLELRLSIPRDVAAPQGEVLITHPGALTRDPEVTAVVARRDPALVAWAHAVAGDDIPPTVAARMSRQQSEAAGWVAGSPRELSTACAVVAWSTAPREETMAHDARRRALSALRALRNRRADEPEEDDDEEGNDLAMRMAVLAALASGAGGLNQRSGNSLSALVESLRGQVRRALRNHRSDADLMARGAAALLLADSRDSRGLAMLELAREHLRPGLRGGRLVAVDEESDALGGAREVVATAALAVAASQAGDEPLTRELALGLAARAHVALGLGGEPTFWLFAASAYGVFGIDDVEQVTVDVGREQHNVTLEEGVGRFPLPAPRPGRRVQVTLRREAGDQDATLLVRALARYGRPPVEREGSPLRTRVEGDPGHVGEQAALEARVTNSGDERIEHPVLLVTLPANAVLDDQARQQLASGDAVVGVDEPDRHGVVRIRLAPLDAEEEAAVPLPVRWLAAGEVTGFSVAAFAGDRPWELSVTPPGTYHLEPRPEEE